MNISLTTDANNFVASQLAHGGYTSAEEVVEEALLLLKQREEWLKAEIQKGMDSELVDGEEAMKNIRNRLTEKYGI